MQGSIYTAFSDMIIENIGMEQWNELIDETSPKSQGIYTSGEQYDDSEIIEMVKFLSNKTGIEINVLIEEFGRYLFKKLYETCPVDISNINNLKEFLLAIDQLIHVEVQRLHPKAYLPKFEYDTSNKDSLIMYYSSKRKLCGVSVGLIFGAAEHFKEKITIGHPQCMHNGAERCKLIIQFNN
jgi:predicted hydrocarbon binding protein